MLQYATVTNRMGLAILKPNIAGTMSCQLEQYSLGITQFTSGMTAVHEQAKKLEFQLTEVSKEPAKPKETNCAETNGPLPSKVLDQAGMPKAHRNVQEEAQVQYKIVQPIVPI